MTEHTTDSKAKVWDGPTPYDAKIEAIRSAGIPSIYLQGKAEGYRAAMNSEVVCGLCEAAQVGLTEAKLGMSDHVCHDDDCPDAQAAKLIEKNIAAYAVGLKGEA